MKSVHKRTLALLLIVVLVAMQAGNAWAMPMADAPMPGLDHPVMTMSMSGSHQAMDTGSVQDLAATDTVCDNQTASDCSSCAHCIAVLMSFGTVIDKPVLPHTDRIIPSVTSTTLIHFKPPRLA
jgi:hypothetical protein